MDHLKTAVGVLDRLKDMPFSYTLLIYNPEVRECRKIITQALRTFGKDVWYRYLSRGESEFADRTPAFYIYSKTGISDELAIRIEQIADNYGWEDLGYEIYSDDFNPDEEITK